MDAPRVRVIDQATGKALKAVVLPPARRRSRAPRPSSRSAAPPSTVEGGQSSTSGRVPLPVVAEMTERQQNLRELGLAIRRARRGGRRGLVEAAILGALDVLARRAGL